MLAAGARRLAAAGVADPQRDVRVLARWATGWDGAALSARLDEPASPDAAQRLVGAVAARAARRPASQIVGGRAFYGRWFGVDARVLDPRPESETVVEAALAALPADREARVLDLGVGSGCLLLSVLAERARAQGVGVDASEGALAIAAANAAALGVAARAELRLGDWLEGVSGRFDAVLCNPPYIPADEIADLAPEVRWWEPLGALTPGGDGLAVYRLLAPRLERVLTPDGVAAFEVGRGQAEPVSAIARAAGLSAQVLSDLGGAPRVVLMRRAA